MSCVEAGCVPVSWMYSGLISLVITLALAVHTWWFVRRMEALRKESAAWRVTTTQRMADLIEENEQLRAELLALKQLGG